MQSPKNPVPQLVLSYGEAYFNALFAAHFPGIPDQEAVILKQKLKDFCQFYPHQVDYQTITELFTEFELDLINKGNSEQASAMLRQTLTPAQKTALKKVIEETVPSMEWHENVRGDKYQAVSLEQTLEDLVLSLTEE